MEEKARKAKRTAMMLSENHIELFKFRCVRTLVELKSNIHRERKGLKAQKGDLEPNLDSPPHH
jgi:hypothetical protein